MMAKQKQRVLLVDDDRGLLRLLAMRLESAGYNVAAVTSGEEALSRLPAYSPGLVITDLKMAGMDGMKFFKTVHKRSPTLPVIMLTAHGTIPDAVEATRQGIFSFVTKPFDAKELLSKVKSAFSLPGSVVGDSLANDSWCSSIITKSTAMQELLSQARLVAASDASVFIYGENGTGRELLARSIHKASRRSKGPFVPVKCSAVPEQLLESEFFGHRKGSFSGAMQDHDGLFQAADGGTLFLDEIESIPLAFQAKLLRALQENSVRPLGSGEDVAIDVRIIVATPPGLGKALSEGSFREDLYYRLNVVTLEIPPLSQRREDIPLLANYFLSKIGKPSDEGKRFSAEAMELLMAAPWPGNVRQLYNVVEQAAVLSSTPLIPASFVEHALCDKPVEIQKFADARNHFERDYLTQILQMTNGNVTQAARLAGRNRTEFYKLLNKHHIAPVMFK